MFTPVAGAPDDGRLPAEVKDKALSMDLFGRETLGGHLGLFGEAILLSAPPVEATGLAAEAFAESLLAFSRFAGEVEQKLSEATVPSAEPEPAGVPENGFIKV